MTQMIDQFEVEIDSIKHSDDGHGGFEIRAFAPSAVQRHALPSVFFRMYNYTLAPRIGERVTVTVKKECWGKDAVAADQPPIEE